jgi:hypothetical protein
MIQAAQNCIASFAVTFIGGICDSHSTVDEINLF